MQTRNPHVIIKNTLFSEYRVKIRNYTALMEGEGMGVERRVREFFPKIKLAIPV